LRTFKGVNKEYLRSYLAMAKFRRNLKTSQKHRLQYKF